MTEIELLDKSFKLIRDGLIFGEVIHKEHVESFLQENERKINELETENERLKAELQQSATKCNKLKCLALHLFGHLGFYASEWYSDYDEERKTRRAVKWWKIHLKYTEAYRKEKKELKEKIK